MMFRHKDWPQHPLMPVSIAIGFAIAEEAGKPDYEEIAEDNKVAIATVVTLGRLVEVLADKGLLNDADVLKVLGSANLEKAEVVL